MEDNKNEVLHEDVTETSADGMQIEVIPTRTVHRRAHQSKTLYMVTLAILTALVVVLQLGVWTVCVCMVRRAWI